MVRAGRPSGGLLPSWSSQVTYYLAVGVAAEAPAGDPTAPPSARLLRGLGREGQRAMKIGNVSFGGTAAIVTSVALIFGLDAATATKSTIVSGLLIVALADNLTDALSMHIYQESERRLESREAFLATWSNFITRLLLALTFVLLVVLLPISSAVIVSAAWGLSLLIALTWALARERKVRFAVELAKHCAAALAVILASRGIGAFITARFP